MIENLTTALRRLLESGRPRASGEWIIIEGLEVSGKVGVPEVERRQPQRLVVSLKFQIPSEFRGLSDGIERTIDYSQVAAEVRRIVANTSAHLIETLIVQIADRLMEKFPIRRLQIELRKFILPDASYVSVTLERPGI